MENPSVLDRFTWHHYSTTDEKFCPWILLFDKRSVFISFLLCQSLFCSLLAADLLLKSLSVLPLIPFNMQS